MQKNLSTEKKKTANQQAIVTLRDRLGYNQQQLAHELRVSLRAVAGWETREEPSTDYWGKLAELARHYRQLDLVPVFLQARLAKERIPIAAWQIAVTAISEWQQLLTAGRLKPDLRHQLEDDVIELRKALDEDETGTSAPNGEQLKKANLALDRIRKIRTAAQIAVKSTE